MPIPLVTRILVADDHALVRDGLKHVIDAEPDLEVVAEAADGAEALERALVDDIDLAILDISMPRMTGLQAARELSHRRPQLRLLILSMYENEQFLFEALKVGASGYVLKSGADDDIVDACRAAMRGESFLYPWGADIRSHAAGASSYSWIRPPRRSWRFTLAVSVGGEPRVIGVPIESGARRSRARCGLWLLWWRT